MLKIIEKTYKNLKMFYNLDLAFKRDPDNVKDKTDIVFK